MSRIRMVVLACALLALPFVGCTTDNKKDAILVNQCGGPFVFFLGAEAGVTVEGRATKFIRTANFSTTTSVTVKTPKGKVVAGPVIGDFSGPTFIRVTLTPALKIIIERK